MGSRSSAARYSADAFVAQAGEGDVTAVNLFFDSGMPADIRDERGNAALTNAAAGGHLPVVTELLKKGAAADRQA